MLLSPGRGARRGTAPLPRPMIVAELPQVVALWRTCGLVAAMEDPAPVLTQMLAHGNAAVLVIEHDGKPAAAIRVGHDGQRGWLDQLAVAPKQRRLGLGRALVAGAEAWLRARAIGRAYAVLRPATITATPFLAALGYGPESERLLGRRLDDVAAARDIEVTITALRMDTRPPGGLAPLPASQPLLLRLQNPAVSYYRHLYNEVGRPWLWYERRRMTDEALAALITDPDVHIHVPYVGGVPAGFFELDARRHGLVQLTYFGLAPAFIGQRIGPWMLEQAVQVAWNLRPSRLWVHTCTLDHPKALPMYKRGGFTVFDRRTERIPDPTPWMV